MRYLGATEERQTHTHTDLSSNIDEWCCVCSPVFCVRRAASREKHMRLNTFIRRIRGNDKHAIEELVVSSKALNFDSSRQGEEINMGKISTTNGMAKYQEQKKKSTRLFEALIDRVTHVEDTAQGLRVV
jgi:hypothetical protein